MGVAKRARPGDSAATTQLTRGAEKLLGRDVMFRHVVFNDAETFILERQKPWLFRCEC
jgi:hypothetical protein